MSIYTYIITYIYTEYIFCQFPQERSTNKQDWSHISLWASLRIHNILVELIQIIIIHPAVSPVGCLCVGVHQQLHGLPSSHSILGNWKCHRATCCFLKMAKGLLMCRYKWPHISGAIEAIEAFDCKFNAFLQWFMVSTRSEQKEVSWCQLTPQSSQPGLEKDISKRLKTPIIRGTSKNLLT